MKVGHGSIALLAGCTEFAWSVICGQVMTLREGCCPKVAKFHCYCLYFVLFQADQIRRYKTPL